MEEDRTEATPEAAEATAADTPEAGEVALGGGEDRAEEEATEAGVKRMQLKCFVFFLHICGKNL